MCERLIEQKNCISLALDKEANQTRAVELNLTPAEWKLLKQVVEVLCPFKLATDVAQKENNVSISYVLAALVHLQKSVLVALEQDDPCIIAVFHN